MTQADSLDEMRSTIDREIARLKESIRALYSRRNELSTISCLPAEILCKIFSLVVCYSGPSPKTSTNFSRVSQHWRSTALSAPEIWSKISLSYPHRWVQELLIRSKMAKLTILSVSSLYGDTLNFRSCLNEMDRIEELNLSPIPVLKFDDLPKSAPQLHALYIRCTTSTTYPFLEDLLHDAERLQRVVLSNCKISWDCRLLTGLTHLNLRNSLKEDSSMTQFLLALQRMPALTDLRLMNSVPDDSEGSSIYPVVDLPCLRVFHISSGAAALTTVLRHISIPHSTVSIITCRENQSAQIDFSNFLSVLFTKLLSSFVIRRLSLQVSDAQTLKFYLSTTAALEDHRSNSLISEFQLQLFLVWPSSLPHSHVKALTSAFNAMSLSFLTQLRISLSTLDYINPQTWVKTFGTLPLLNRVCVAGSSPLSFLNALVYKTEAAEKSETAYHNVSFPKLRHIELEGTDFSAKIFRKLLNCLEERSERKAEVQVLHLNDCYYVSYKLVARLREVVDDVSWDGMDPYE